MIRGLVHKSVSGFHAFAVWSRGHKAALAGIDESLRGRLWDHALVISVISSIPVKSLWTSPLFFLFFVALSYFFLIHFFRKYVLFCAWVNSRRRNGEGLCYVNRQEEIFFFESLLGVLQSRQCSGLVFGSGLVTALFYFSGNGAHRWLIPFVMTALPLFCSLRVLSPPGKPPSFLLLKERVAFIGALLLWGLSTTAGILEALQKGGSYLFFLIGGALSLALVLIVLIPMLTSRSRMGRLYRMTVLDDWKVQFDLTSCDLVFSPLKAMGHHVLKKFCFQTKELRNAVALTERSVEIGISNAKTGFITGVLVEHPRGKPGKGEIRLFLNDHLVLHRPLSSFSQGWNSFCDLWHPLDEPLPKGFPKEEPVLSGTGEDRLRAEVARDGDRVFLECPHVLRTPEQPKTIVVLLVDALCKDGLGFYGARDTSTPYLDAFFKKGAVYHNAWAQGEWTTTNIGHMFTSMYSSHHRSVHRYEGYKHPLPLKRKTLAEVFQENGWFTYFLSGTQRVSQAKGYDRGFSKMTILPYAEMMNWDVVYRCLDQLEAYKRENKFVLLHLMDVHGPPVFWSHKRDVHARFRQHNRRDIFRKTHPEEFDRLNKNQVEEFDLGISLLLSYLNQSPWGEHTAVVLTADHGQLPPPQEDDPVGQKDVVLSKATLNVPLAVSCPWRRDLQGKQFDGLVEVGVDFYPSMLDLAGLRGEVMPYSRSFLPGPDGAFHGKDYAMTESIYEGIVQRVIRKRDLLYYSRYNWREDERASEEIWFIEKGGKPRPTEGDEFVKHRETFQEIIRRVDIVEPGDDPVEFYGSF